MFVSDILKLYLTKDIVMYEIMPYLGPNKKIVKKNYENVLKDITGMEDEWADEKIWLKRVHPKIHIIISRTSPSSIIVFL